MHTDIMTRVYSERLTFHASLAASNSAGVRPSVSRSINIFVVKLTRGRCNLVLGPMIDEYTHDIKHLRPGEKGMSTKV
jgi:hypothetical protein